MILVWAAAAAALLWCLVLAAPWRPWSTRETLAAQRPAGSPDLRDITAVIPARNEAPLLAVTLPALAAQGTGLAIVLVDDQSDDGTAALVAALGIPGLEVVRGKSTPPDWTGKTWAVQQGLGRVRTPLTLLLDADVKLEPGALAALRRRMTRERVALASLMAAPAMAGFWDKLLMPAFVYFFKLLYPFALSNRPSWRRVAAAAGGCVLLDTAKLHEMAGLAAIRSRLIDDCALARAFKARGHAIWIGLTRDARSLRAHAGLAEIGRAVARFAYVQLRCSPAWLAAVTVVMLLAFAVPPVAALAGSGADRAAGALAWTAMAASYVPILRYYGRGPVWSAALPLIGLLYLGMTWWSAWRHWSGTGVQWRGRSYSGAAFDNGRR
ncbi:MAG: glycosyltransferase [Pseudomonadota bacterium]